MRHANVLTLSVVLSAVALSAAPLSAPARAGDLVAVVEEAGDGAGVQIMDFLEVGQRIALPAGGRLVLGYIHSCVRETIQGGQITVGKGESTVDGGQVARESTECANLMMEPASGGDQRETAAVVFRKPPNQKVRADDPDMTIFGYGPVVRLWEPTDELVIQRLDRFKTTIRIPVDARVVDLERQGVNLKAGGLYELTAGGRRLIVKVSPRAERNAPIIARLVLL
ncbi:MAG: hypothetical protein H6907_15040 [Hyphomicrobiales bacterium]|nr:hypothetical protein [Hyphomicrobiales bacterium]